LVSSSFKFKRAHNLVQILAQPEQSEGLAFGKLFQMRQTYTRAIQASDFE